MFDTLMDSTPAKGKRGFRQIYMSTGSVIVHGVILISLITASYLHVEPLP